MDGLTISTINRASGSTGWGVTGVWSSRQAKFTRVRQKNIQLGAEADGIFHAAEYIKTMLSLLCSAWGGLDDSTIKASGVWSFTFGILQGWRLSLLGVFCRVHEGLSGCHADGIMRYPRSRFAGLQYGSHTSKNKYPPHLFLWYPSALGSERWLFWEGQCVVVA